MRHLAAFPAICLLACALASPQAIVNPPEAAKVSTAVLWKDPGNINSLDLFYGPGGKKHQPRAPFEFVKEDTKGTSPKFDVKDAEGKKWRAKLGPEARPETVASRLMWAAGYLGNETYYFPKLAVDKMPATLHRGQQYLTPRGEVLTSVFSVILRT